MRNRPIRFGTGGGRVADRERLIAAARRAEDIGYSTFSMADHFHMPFLPRIAAPQWPMRRPHCV